MQESDSLNVNVVPVGGRIKSAAVGINHLYKEEDLVRLNNSLTKLRHHPLPELLQAFFPADSVRLKQMMKGIGFYRPVLKTDQGMAGNFLPFRVDLELSLSDLSPKYLSDEEGIAIPETWYPHDPVQIRSVQEAFWKFKLFECAEALDHMPKRLAEKGREPFFFIRPALTNPAVVFGKDMVDKVVGAVCSNLAHIAGRARMWELSQCGGIRPINLIYCQPDVYVLRDGTVWIEKINCPDVCFFLKDLQNPYSRILPTIQEIVGSLTKSVCQAIAERIPQKFVYLVTRSEVLEKREDLLELGEIQTLQNGLAEMGKRAEVVRAKEIECVPQHSHLVLLNLNYKSPEVDVLLTRHARGEVTCYPNPFFQAICQNSTGLPEIELAGRYREKFLELTGSHPKGEVGLRDVLRRIQEALSKHGMESDILQANTASESLPIFRKAIHSWQQFSCRIKRYAELPAIHLRQIPVRPDNLLLHSPTGPRLHVFRFMFVSRL